MKRLAAFAGTMFICSYLFAVPAPVGVSGLGKVISATPEHIGRFYFIWGGKFSQARNDDNISLRTISTTVVPGIGSVSDTSYSAIKGNSIMGDVPFGLGFSITNCLEVSVSTAFLIDAMEDSVPGLATAAGSGCVSYGFTDTELSIKFTPTQISSFVSPEISKKFNLGLLPIFSFPTGAERSRIPDNCSNDTVFGYKCRKNDGGIHRFYTNGGVAFGGKLLLSGVLVTEPPLVAHANAGFMKYPEGENKYTYGVGVEGQYQFFSPFLEVYWEHRIPIDTYSDGTYDYYDDGGTYITPGLRFETAKNTWVTLAVDFKIIGDDRSSCNYTDNLPDSIWNARYQMDGFGTTPPWRASLILSHGFDYMKPPEPSKVGEIAGKITDKEDDRGIKGVVALQTLDTTITTDEEGNYKATLPVGKTVIMASAVDKDKYKPSAEQTVWIESGGRQVVNFKLEKRPVEQPATLTGSIIDRVSRKPCSANISFPEAQLPVVTSDDAGVYRTDIPAGTYVLKVEKTGYITETRPVVCEAGKTTVLDIELSPATSATTIAGKVIDYATKKAIGGAKISFPNTQLPTIMSEATTGTYKTTIPSGTYTVKIEADGYVPEGVAIICEPNANLLKDFELFKKEEKIVLRGINFKVNSAVIKSESYPILNDAADLLKQHPDVKVEIAGHASSEGNPTHNLTLSQLRAESVRTYLINSGIEGARLTARGYGITQPIADNSTEPGRQQNRRIEFRIQSK